VSPELRRRVEQLRRDQHMLVQLEEARLQRSAGGNEPGFDMAGCDRLYASAFAEYGLDLKALGPQEAAQRVRVSEIGDHLSAALDDWAVVRNNLIPGGGAALRAVADLADDDPWRRRLRDAAARGDRIALENLAEEKGTLSQRPASLMLLAEALHDAGSWAATERLLRQAQSEHPADFWINFKLAYTLSTKKPPDLGDAVRFYQAALALRPQSPGVYNNLGADLKGQGRPVDAELALRKAVTLQPHLAIAHFNRGNALISQGKNEEAIAAFDRAIELQPGLAAEAYNSLGADLARQRKL